MNGTTQPSCIVNSRDNCFVARTNQKRGIKSSYIILKCFNENIDPDKFIIRYHLFSTRRQKHEYFKRKEILIKYLNVFIWMNRISHVVYIGSILIYYLLNFIVVVQKPVTGRNSTYWSIFHWYIIIRYPIAVTREHIFLNGMMPHSKCIERATIAYHSADWCFYSATNRRNLYDTWVFSK